MSDTSLARELIVDRRPLRLRRAARALGACVANTAVLLARRRISLPTDHVGQVLHFDDGSHARVYRETRIREAPVDSPVLLVVSFRLRWVHGRGHALFRAESLLNTVLFAGFPGLVSKLWLTNDDHGVYRGFYEWNGSVRADDYVRALWWVLALVSVPDSIHYAVVPGLRRDHVLADPALLDRPEWNRPGAWWHLTAVERPHSTAFGRHGV